MSSRRTHLLGARVEPEIAAALGRVAAAEHRTTTDELRRLIHQRVAAAEKATAPEVTGADREDQPIRAAGRVEF